MVDYNARHDELTAQVRGRECARCGGLIRVAWWYSSGWVARCDCWPADPDMRRAEGRVKQRTRELHEMEGRIKETT